MAPRAEAARGFTLLGLLFLVAIMGVLAMAASATVRFASQRDREAQLLFVGNAYRDALTRFARARAGHTQAYPTDLAQLLRDPEQQGTVRYLRRLYFDPMTGSDDWGLVKNPLGGITGVYSKSTEHPIRGPKAPGMPDDFSDAETYADWVFSPIKHKPAATPPPAPQSTENDEVFHGYVPQPLPPVVPDHGGE